MGADEIRIRARLTVVPYLSEENKQLEPLGQRLQLGKEVNRRGTAEAVP